LTNETAWFISIIIDAFSFHVSQEPALSELTSHIGKRIRSYRKIRGLSSGELAALIHKSKATVSKYESGQIAIDIDTLFEIAGALGVLVAQLIDLDRKVVRPVKEGQSGGLTSPELFLYYFDRRNKRVALSVIHNGETIGEQRQKSILYLCAKSSSEYENCRAVFAGTVFHSHLITNFNFESQLNASVQCSIFVTNRMVDEEVSRGIISGMSDKPFMPVAFRCIISEREIAEDDPLLEECVLSKAELPRMVKYNMLQGFKND
jgi:transcriptional regulator with XRE-family HTH domain